MYPSIKQDIKETNTNLKKFVLPLEICCKDDTHCGMCIYCKENLVDEILSDRYCYLFGDLKRDNQGCLRHEGCIEFSIPENKWDNLENKENCSICFEEEEKQDCRPWKNPREVLPKDGTKVFLEIDGEDGVVATYMARPNNAKGIFISEEWNQSKEWNDDSILQWAVLTRKRKYELKKLGYTFN